MKKVIVYSYINSQDNSFDDVTFELITKARSLSDNVFVEVVALGNEIINDSLSKIYSAGCNSFVFIKDETLKNFSSGVLAQSFVEYFKTNPADAILFPADKKGRMVAPRITTMLDVGLVADCVDIELIDYRGKEKFAFTRPTFGSELMATIISTSSVECATIRKGVFEAEFKYGNKGEYKEFKITPYEEPRIRLINSFIETTSKPCEFLPDDIILTAGFGLNSPNKEYCAKLQKIAKKLNLKFGATRKVVDYNLAPHNIQIGQTGATVNSKAYVAFGVSGAIQHISGMKNSKKIIAINMDENAEIFKYSDYKIVADAKVIIDELLKLIE